MRHIIYIIFTMIISTKIVTAQSYPDYRVVESSIPNDEKIIEGMVYSIVQGIKQDNIGLILNPLDSLTSNNSSYLTKSEIKDIFLGFFTLSKSRKNHDKWIKLSPEKTKNVNWDFEIEKPEIYFSKDEAIASFHYYWLIDAPIGNQHNSKLAKPTKKYFEQWHFNKKNNRWSIIKMDSFLKEISNN